MTTSLITIGITCYNEGDWLQECWESVLAQTDDRWQAVLVMDGTTHQRTREVFDNLSHPKLRKVALQENGGPYPTRNVAFQMTSTLYHFYLDGDDQLLPNSIQMVLDTFEKYPEAAIVYGDYEFFGSENLVVRFPRIVTQRDMVEWQCIPGPCAYKTEVWHKLGGFSNALSRGNGDYDFHIGAMEAGFHAYHCCEVFYRYRVGHATKVSNSYSLRYHETHQIIVKRHPKFFEDRSLLKRFIGRGYIRAAVANLQERHKIRAVTLALSALKFGRWKDQSVWAVIAKVVLPKPAYLVARALWRGLHGLSVRSQEPVS